MSNSSDFFQAQAGNLKFFQSTSRSVSIFMKNEGSDRDSLSSADFKTSWDLNRTHLNIESVSYNSTADTTEQTVIDTNDTGILTNVIAPALSAAGTMTIRVTIDGKLYTFISETTAIYPNELRFCLGGILNIQPAIGTTGGGFGGTTDQGWDGAFITHAHGGISTVLTPAQCLYEGIGLPFKSSLKVTVQGSVNLNSTVGQKEAYVAYSTSQLI